jgi:uncharacterized protein (DUF1684 family)
MANSSLNLRTMLVLVVFAAGGLTRPGVLAQSTDTKAETEAFRKQREAEIGGPTGWIALVGLHWLDIGAHTIGRGPNNAVALSAPSSPDRLGVVTVTAESVSLQVAPGVDARVKGQPVTAVELRSGGPEAGLTVGGMTLVVIRRGGRVGLRVWDSASEARTGFKGLQWLPIDAAWRFDARFVAHAPAPRMRILNVLGDTVEMANPGYVSFTIAGQEYHLEALLESANAKELFFMFRDATSGKTTYGAGRYLYTELPKDGRVIVDFNRAMNPPCAFTEFATCPLPPAANRLPIGVTAGELNDGHPARGTRY